MPTSYKNVSSKKQKKVPKNVEGARKPIAKVMSRSFEPFGTSVSTSI
jgi:hypothetical protein